MILVHNKIILDIKKQKTRDYDTDLVLKTSVVQQQNENKDVGLTLCGGYCTEIKSVKKTTANTLQLAGFMASVWFLV